MRRAKTAYELSQSQVSTPSAVVRQFWQIVHNRRKNFGVVLDLGAGDCRFAKGGSLKQYVGIEIDPTRAAAAMVPKNGKLITGCAFAHRGVEYDACIGNPPYVRHHDLDSSWRDRIAHRIEKDLGVRLNKKSNLFVYFLCLGLLKTSENGLVALVVPFEWVSRPSTAPLRAFLREQGWKVDVFRYTDGIFDGVLTTACITIIDKGCTSKQWSYFDLSSTKPVHKRRNANADLAAVLPYSGRGAVWAMRGMSPGCQKIFCLTEGERIHHGLTKNDVLPCVTSLRPLPHEVESLTEAAFNKYFVMAGERCWLLKSHVQKPSDHVKSYLKGVPSELHDNYTCNKRRPWYRFQLHDVPQLLVGSGFVTFGPKVVRNPVKAHAVGAVTGIHTELKSGIRRVQEYLLKTDFESRVVAHAKTLRKVEVGQLNATLKTLEKRA